MNEVIETNSLPDKEKFDISTAEKLKNGKGNIYAQDYIYGSWRFQFSRTAYLRHSVFSRTPGLHHFPDGHK